MKSWKLVFFALFGAFSLASSACVITSDDDDDNIGDDDDDFGDDDDDDFGGSAGTGNTSGNGGAGGTAGGAGGSGGSGGLTGGTVLDDLVNLFAEATAVNACRSCAQTYCAAQVTACGSANEYCSTSMTCIYDDLRSQDQAGATASVDCAFSACRGEFVVETEMNDFASCISMSCVGECGVNTTVDPVCN